MTRRSPNKQGRTQRRNMPHARLLTAGKSATAMILGYARVSTEDQNLGVQLTALKTAGADMVFVEKISAVNLKRPRFNLMLKFAEPGDTILFHSLSRMWREAEKVITMLRQLQEYGVIWRSLTEPHLDGATAIGRFMVTMTAAKDQLERDQIIERTLRGMQECKRRGMALGRKKLFDGRQTAAIRRDRKRMTAAQVAKKWKCSVGTIDKYAPMWRKSK